MKVLVLLEDLPYPITGAYQQDVTSGIKQMQRIGIEVAVALFSSRNQDVEAFRQYLGLPLTSHHPPTLYDLHRGHWFTRLLNPTLLDGAYYQYYAAPTQDFIRRQIERHQPDLVWVEKTFMSIVPTIAKEYSLPTIFRSHNFEPFHMLDTYGLNIKSLLRLVGRWFGEKLSATSALAVAPITPNDAALYEQWYGVSSLYVLPLRRLPALLRPPRVVLDHKPLEVFFLGSNYRISHNAWMARYIIGKIVPRIQQIAPGEFRFHFLGGKVPDRLKYLEAPDVIFHDFVQDLDVALKRMDVALLPSLIGYGMQLKVFESLARGFPTITSFRGIAGYPYVAGEHLLISDTVDSFVKNLLAMRSLEIRRALSESASARTSSLFNQESLDNQLRNLLRLVRPV